MTLTTLSLGVFLLLAGAYATLFALANLSGKIRYLEFGYYLHCLQWVVAILIATFTPLGAGWKLLVLSSCFLSLKVPSLAWSLLERIHNKEART